MRWLGGTPKPNQSSCPINHLALVGQLYIRVKSLFDFKENALTFKELELFGIGKYGIGIEVEPNPHLRVHRDSGDGYSQRTLLAKILGGTFTGVSKNDSYEVNLMAPLDVEDVDGDRIILASFEFHSLQLESAYNGVLHFNGYLSSVNAHSQGTYDSIRDLRTVEEFEQVPALTTATGRLKYLPPTCAEAQQFIGWQAKLSLRPQVIL